MHADQEVITTEIPISDTIVERFTEGALWDDNGWEIHHHAEVRKWEGHLPCKHASAIHTKEQRRADGSTYSVECWIIPRAVVAYNEGGYCTTGVCMDCILEAAK